MRDRRRKIQRILQVQRQLHDVAEWKLAELSRRGTEIDAAKISLIAALNEDDALQGLFIDTMARRLTRLAGEADHVNAAKTAQAAQVLAEARRVKTTERLSGRLERETRRQKEKLDFRALLDAFAQLRDASSR
jgi:hypothetical protein